MSINVDFRYIYSQKDQYQDLHNLSLFKSEKK